MIAHLAEAWPLAVIATITRLACTNRRRGCAPHVPAEVDLAACVEKTRAITYGDPA